MRVSRALTVVSLLLLMPAALAAQANPPAALFTASPDHAAVDLGVPVVASYALEWLDAAAPNGTALQTVDLGKPAPNGANDISVDLAALRPKLAALKPGSYVLRAVAKGPGGDARSAVSAPFTLAVRPPTAPGGAPRLGSSGTASTPPALRIPTSSGPSATAAAGSPPARSSASGGELRGVAAPLPRDLAEEGDLWRLPCEGPGCEGELRQLRAGRWVLVRPARWTLYEGGR